MSPTKARAFAKGTIELIWLTSQTWGQVMVIKWWSNTNKIPGTRIWLQVNVKEAADVHPSLISNVVLLSGHITWLTTDHASFVSPSCSYASTTSGWQQTQKGFWSWSQESLPWTSWSAPSSLSAWHTRSPSSLTTWPRWSFPKTAWPCWREWRPWRSSVWLCCC